MVITVSYLELVGVVSFIDWKFAILESSLLSSKLYVHTQVEYNARRRDKCLHPTAFTSIFGVYDSALFHISCLENGREDVISILRSTAL